MKVVLAKTAGFCWGVRRAMDAVLEASAHGDKPVQTLGPLIHNPQALDLIGRRGVRTASSPTDLGPGTAVIRAHGIPIQDLRDLRERQKKGELSLVNATCPEVAKVHSRIKRWSPKGYFTVILGVHGHAESVAHRSFAAHGSMIVANLEEARSLEDDQLKRVLVVAQTTFSPQEFDEISHYIQGRSEDCIIENTICEDTWTRQGEAERITSMVDVVVVVGGKNSANTKHLAELAEKRGKPVQYVEVASEMDMNAFTGTETVGVLAGASTPTWLVEEVVDVLEQHGKGPGVAGRVYREVLGTPLLLAFGAGCTSMGFHHWLGGGITFLPALTALGYVLAMFLLAPYFDRESMATKSPAESRFLVRQKSLILSLGVLSLAGAFGASSLIGLKALFALGLASVAGILYPARIRAGSIHLSLQSIPGSKEVLVAMALGLVLVVLPLLDGGSTWNFQAVAATVFVATMAFARTAIHNLRDLQNDRILGVETLPSLLGRNASMGVMAGLLALSLGLVAWAMPWTVPVRAGLSLGVMTLAAAYFPVHWWLFHARFSVGHRAFEPPLELAFFLIGLLILI